LGGHVKQWLELAEGQFCAGFFKDRYTIEPVIGCDLRVAIRVLGFELNKLFSADGNI
jgi:hypothetical protein